MEIKARRWLAIWFRCPKCGAQQANPRLDPTRKNRDYRPHCWGLHCDRVELEAVECRYYTTFASDFYSTAGTLKEIGPFKVCDIVHSNIRAFRKWVAQREAEQAEQARIYFAKQKVIQEESAARLKKQKEEEALLKDAAAVVYKRTHAAEMIAEQVARAVWPAEEEQSVQPLQPFQPHEDLGDLEDWPF